MREACKKLIDAQSYDQTHQMTDPLQNLLALCVRNATHEVLCDGIDKVLALYALEEMYVLAFHVRNIRGGKGERDVFQKLFAELHRRYPALSEMVMDLIPVYGCWGDLYRMVEGMPARFKKKVLDITETQLRTDMLEDNPSLCAKWAPRESKYKHLAAELAHRLFPTIVHHSSIMKNYRKYVATLNARLNTVETHMCANRWGEINPEQVPTRAHKVYKRAFLNLVSTYRAPDQRESRAFRSDDEGRIMCRARCMNYVRQSTIRPVEMTDPCYDRVRQRVRAYLRNAHIQ